MQKRYQVNVAVYTHEEEEKGLGVVLGRYTYGGTFLGAVKKRGYQQRLLRQEWGQEEKEAMDIYFKDYPCKMHIGDGISFENDEMKYRIVDMRWFYLYGKITVVKQEMLLEGSGGDSGGLPKKGD